MLLSISGPATCGSAPPSSTVVLKHCNACVDQVAGYAMAATFSATCKPPPRCCHLVSKARLNSTDAMRTVSRCSKIS